MTKELWEFEPMTLAGLFRPHHKTAFGAVWETGGVLKAHLFGETVATTEDLTESGGLSMMDAVEQKWNELPPGLVMHLKDFQRNYHP